MKDGRLRILLRSHGLYLSVQIVFFLIFIWWLPEKHLPLPGFAVGIIALLAAVMSVHPNMRHWQRIFWLLLIGFFLITELRAIRKDRDESNAQALEERKAQDYRFQAIRQEENRQFETTADSLKRAISGIQSTLKAADKTLIQTQPHADIRFERIEFSDGTPPRLETNHDYSLNYWYTNDGDASARNLRVLVKFYFAKVDDKAAQEELVRRFESSWAKGEGASTTAVIAPHLPKFGTTDRRFENNEFNDPVGTLHYLLRFEYSDDTGRWRSDTCELIQRRSTAQMDYNINHTCLVFERSRYAVSERTVRR